MNFVETIEDEKKLTEEEKNKLATQIAENFKKWDTDQNEQVATANRIMAETYLRQSQKGKKNDWQSKVNLNAIYNIKRAKKAVLWREMWSNPSQMFDVQGTSENTEKTAKAQKAALVDSLKKMDVGKAFDEGIDNLFDIGEIVFKTDWERKTKIIKRQKRNKGFEFLNLIRNRNNSGIIPQSPEMQDIELPYYENARVESISPLLFVFDHAKYDGKKETWNSIVKISKTFATLENIKNDKNYQIPKEAFEELKNEGENGENKTVSELRDYNEYSGMHSILFAHGDFKINGKTFQNYIAVVLAGKYLIRFEKNPLWICPFIYCALEQDPKTKRGISPLKSVIDMCEKEQDLFNTYADVQKLTANPCYWADEQLFDSTNTDSDGNVLKVPGKILKYKSGFTGSLPTKVDVSAGGISDLLAFLNNQISEVSAVSDVMFGNIESAKRTATELNLADKGSTSQIGKELDTIYQNLTIPMIENVAELLAMFKDGNEFIYYEEKGKRIELQITNAIRQAQYNYYYEDRNALYERKQKFQDLFNLFKEVGQSEELSNMINWREVITQAVEMIGFDNSDKFFNPETPTAKLLTQVEQLPEELQNQLAPVLQQAIQGFMQNMQMQQMQMQQAQMPINGGM